MIDSGDVQWMTAAGGVLHKEFHEKEYAKINHRTKLLRQIKWVSTYPLMKA